MKLVSTTGKGLEAIAALTERGAAPYERVLPEARRLVEAVRRGGDTGLLCAREKLDHIPSQAPLRIPAVELQLAWESTPPALQQALKTSARNIRAFAVRQRPKDFDLKPAPGVTTGQRVVPLASVGCYIPSGRYPLLSTLLMTAIPAQVAGVAAHRRRLATIRRRKRWQPHICSGLPSSIGSAALMPSPLWPTAPPSIPRVDKIVGPGNAYVTAAKKPRRFRLRHRHAGRSDRRSSSPARPAAQPTSPPISSPRPNTIPKPWPSSSPPRPIWPERSSPGDKARSAQQSSSHDSRSAAMASSIVARNSTKPATSPTASPPSTSPSTPPPTSSWVRNAGSVFIGRWSAQPMGDYVSGPNHTLPTGGMARVRGGLSVIRFRETHHRPASTPGRRSPARSQLLFASPKPKDSPPTRRPSAPDSARKEAPMTDIKVYGPQPSCHRPPHEGLPPAPRRPQRPSPRFQREHLRLFPPRPRSSRSHLRQRPHPLSRARARRGPRRRSPRPSSAPGRCSPTASTKRSTSSSKPTSTLARRSSSQCRPTPCTRSTPQRHWLASSPFRPKTASAFLCVLCSMPSRLRRASSPSPIPTVLRARSHHAPICCASSTPRRTPSSLSTKPTSTSTAKRSSTSSDTRPMSSSPAHFQRPTDSPVSGSESSPLQKRRCIGSAASISPYSVNSVALTCLTAALDDEDYLRWYVGEVLASRPLFESTLQRLGVPYWPSQANFVLVEIGPKHREFVTAMRTKGVLVRDRSNDPGCDGCVRITLGTREQTQQRNRRPRTVPGRNRAGRHPRPELSHEEAHRRDRPQDR